jgi:hypothetical protein
VLLQVAFGIVSLILSAKLKSLMRVTALQALSSCNSAAMIECFSSLKGPGRNINSTMSFGVTTFRYPNLIFD